MAASVQFPFASYRQAQPHQNTSDLYGGIFGQQQRKQFDAQKVAKDLFSKSGTLLTPAAAFSNASFGERANAQRQELADYMAKNMAAPWEAQRRQELMQIDAEDERQRRNMAPFWNQQPQSVARPKPAISSLGGDVASVVGYIKTLLGA